MARKVPLRGWTMRSVFCHVVLGFSAIISVLGTSPGSFSEFSFVVEPNDTVVARESTSILQCHAQHNTDTPQMQWIRDGVFLNLNADSRRELLSNGSLKFSTVIHSRTDRPDEGVYQCVASVNDLGSIVSRKAKLQVAYLGKTFVREPQDLAVHLGDTAMFDCAIDGQPRPSVRWYKDDRELNIDNINYIVHRDGVLEVSDVQVSDLGIYKCQAENIDRSRTSAGGTLSRNADSSTYQGVSPQFVMQPQDHTAVEGSTGVLYCGANGRDRQGQVPSITWLKDGVTIDMADLDSQFSILGQGSLQIQNLIEEDSGSYTCRATNLEDSVDSEALLTVHIPPRFQKQPINVFAQVNADVEFECDVYGVPRPIIQWLKNGDVVIPSDYFQIVDGRNLRILGLVNSDAGIYQCLAENEVGNVQASAQLVITQKDLLTPPTTPLLTTPLHRTGSSDAAPTELPGPPEHLVARIVSTRFITLSWNMPATTGNSGIRAYSVFWREEDSHRERVLNTTRLEANIQHLKPSTKYEFRVQSYNSAGPSRDLAEITVETKEEVNVPGSPVNIDAVTLSSSSIKVTWDPPTSTNPPITNYKLYYYKSGANREEEMDVDGTEVTLTDLDKFATYNFRVVAYSTNGPGMSTEEVTTRTYSDYPTAPPLNITLETISSTSIIVRWEPPAAETQNGIITGIKIRYKLSPRSAIGRNRGSDTVTTDGNRQSFDLSELERGMEYMIRVQAMNVNGSGPASIWYTGETFMYDLDETTVPGAPSSLRVRPFANSIAVSWTPPEDQSIMVRGYVLGYGIGIPDTYQQDLPSKQRYHTIKSLNPSSEYVISLRAYNNIGSGEIVYETVITREETTPEPTTPMIPPVGLKATVLSPNTIVVTWSDSSLGRNQRITDNRFYTIQYNPRGARRSRTINSTDLNAHIDDLRPNTEYEFSVKVIKGRRESTWSMSVLNKTFEDAPASTPRDLTPVAVEGKHTWITLNWQPPRQPNGQITGYLVFYTTDATQKERDWVVEGVLGDKLSTTIRDLTPETTYYFKVQARNSKGYGPMSPTVIFRTPSKSGMGGGRIETPNDHGQVHLGPVRKGTQSRPNLSSSEDDSSNKSDGKSEGIPPMVLWIVIGCVSGVTFIAIVIVLVIVCKRKMSDADRKKRQGYHPANKGKPGPKMVDIKPPDLWIHDMEMKNMEKGQPETASVSPIPRDNGDIKNMENSPAGEHPYDSHDEDPQRHRRPSRTKPIMIPVEQPPPPREPIATAIPNGHILGLDSHIPRSLYSRPTMPYSQTPPYTSSPRINISADMMQPNAVKPQPQVGTTSPYKKPAPPTGTTASTPYKPRSPLPVVTPKAPDVTIRSGGETDTELPKSYSAEELSAEMANLEGLMKDLNAITQQEFEC